MNPPAPSLPCISPTAKPTFACVRCSERKVRCDRQTPCNACVRHNVQCIFRPPKPPSRRRRKDLTRAKDDLLVEERLKAYEALLQERGIDPSEVQITSGASEAEVHPRESNRTVMAETVWHLPTRGSADLEKPDETLFKPQLLHRDGGTKLVDNSLWSRVAEEIQDAEDTLEEDSANDVSDGGISNDDFAYVLGWRTPNPASLHPPTEVIHRLWQTFVENVNPITKFVHVPTLQSAMEKVVANLDNIPRGFEALMFAIYSMAVLSLTEDACKDLLGETRSTLLPRYIAATKASLSRAKFMSSTSIVVLQALMLHILCIRDIYEPRAVWTLTGLAIRVAEGMGMRLDGKILGLSPFETEIRRRIWWQLVMHDFRAAELCGQSKIRAYEFDETTPKMPLNANDNDLYPTMPQAAAGSTKPTEMIWCMVRMELANFAATQKAKLQKLGKDAYASLEFAAMEHFRTKDDLMKELEDFLETKYLRFCDPSQPLQLMAMLGARAATNVVQFMAHHPRRWASQDQVPASEQQMVWNVVVQLLEQYTMMQSNTQLRRFAWNVPYFIKWDVVIHILDTLRAKPLHLDAVKAWRLVDAIYESNSEMMLSVNRPIFVAVGNLCLKAFDVRVAAQTKTNRNPPDPPEYIAKLREQREAAKRRREVVKPRSKEVETANGGRRSMTGNVKVIWPDTNSTSAEALLEVPLQQDPIFHQPATLTQGTTWTEDDAFWLSDALDEGLCATAAADMMNLDADTILATDNWLDKPDGETIDWAQWDTWLGNHDPMRSKIGP